MEILYLASFELSSRPIRHPGAPRPTFLRLSLTVFFKQSSMVLLIASTWWFLCGKHGVE